MKLSGSIKFFVRPGFALAFALFTAAFCRADLPEGYEALDGIASTASGNQYILTDYVPSSCNVKIEAKVSLVKWATQGIWCSRVNTSTSMMTLFALESGKYFRIDRNGNGSTYVNKAAPLGKPAVLTADYKARTFSIDGVESGVSMASGDFTPTAKLGFFASHTNGTGFNNFAEMSVHYVKVWNAEGDLECEFVPVRKTAKAGTKEEYGLYELKTDKYYPSLATAGFVRYVPTSYEFTEEGDDLLVLTVTGGTCLLSDDDRTRISTSGRTLVKRGDGEVVPGSMPDFTGDIILENGIWQVTEMYALGTNNNTRVVIKSGATLKVNRSLGGTITGKKVYLEGEGYAGNGAIWAATTAWNSITGCKFYLTGDAFINQQARLDYYSFVDTCGYNLRFSGKTSSAIGADFFTNSTDTASTVVVNQNQIIVAQGDGNHYRGSSANRLCLTNGANYSVNWAVKHGWTIEFQNGSKILPQKLLANTETSKASFNGPGPVVLSGTVTVGSGTLKSKGTTNEIATLSAPLRGSGKLVVDPGWLNLKSTDNTYAGTISVKGRSSVARAGIRVYDGAAYSAEKTVLENADFLYENGVGLNLGALEISGDRSTLNGASVIGDAAPTTVSSLTKTGEGQLTLAGNMVVSNADVRSGTLALAKRYYGRAGLMEGIYVDMTEIPAGKSSAQSIWGSQWDDIEAKVGDGNWTYSPDGATKVLNGYNNRVVDGYKRATAVCYKGYLWNRNATNETWTFAMHMTYRIMMRLNGNWTPWGYSGEKTTNLWTQVVKPGANPILVYSVPAAWETSQKPRKTFDALGLSYFRGEVDKNTADPAQFVKLDDGGTGYLLTIDDEGAEAAIDLQPQLLESTFGETTVLDLADNDFKLTNMTGSPAVTNAGTFTLSDRWNLSEGALAADRALTVDGTLAFGGETGLDLGFDPLLCADAATVRLANGAVIAVADEITGLPALSQTLQDAGATLVKSQDGTTLTLTLPAAKSVKVEEGQVKVSIAVPPTLVAETRVKILRDGRVVEERLLGPGYDRFVLNWQSGEPGLYFVTVERVTETGSEKGTIGKVLLASPDVAVRYVSTTGDDKADGTTPSAAMASVQTAVDDLGAAGGTVYVMPGTYTFNKPFNAIVVSNPVSVVGWAEDPSQIVLRRDGSAAPNMRVFQLNHADAALRMVTLAGGYTWTSGSIVWPDKDGSTDMAGGANLYIAPAGGTAENCILTNGTCGGWNYGGGNAFLMAGRLVNCELVGGGMKDLTNDQWRYGGASLAVRGGTVENCWIRRVRSGSSGNAYTVGLYGSARMVNCTVTDNVSYFGNICIGSANVRVYDTAIYDNTATWSDATANADLYVKSSKSGITEEIAVGAFVNCAATRAINGLCRAVAEPGFTDAAHGDYTLAEGSPLVNAGSSAEESGRQCAFDLKGDPRVTKDRVDIGCYEYRAPKFARRGMLIFIR